MASSRITKRGEVVRIPISAPGKATQQHCKWLLPRGLQGCIIQVPPVVKLRHAKLAVGKQYPREKPVVACIRPRIAFVGVCFSGKYSFENVCGWHALLLLWSLTPLLWSFAGQVKDVVLVRNCEICLQCFLIDVLLAADC